MRSVWRLTWSVARGEIVGALVTTAALAIVATVFVARLSAELAAQCPGALPGVGECDLSGIVDLELVRQLVIVVGVVGLEVAAILGGQLVAREIEHGTAVFGWSNARSRTRWLAERSSTMLLPVAVALVTLAAAGHQLTAVAEPGRDLGASFAGYGFRGLGLVARGLAVFGLALLVGAVIGRVLPAVLVSSLLAAAVFALGATTPFVVRPSEVIAPLGSPDIADALGSETAFLAADGRVLSLEEAYASAPPGVNADDWVWQTYERVAVGIPGRRFADVELETSLLLGGLGVGGWLLAAVVVGNRSPE